MCCCYGKRVRPYSLVVRQSGCWRYLIPLHSGATLGCGPSFPRVWRSQLQVGLRSRLLGTPQRGYLLTKIAECWSNLANLACSDLVLHRMLYWADLGRRPMQIRILCLPLHRLPCETVECGCVGRRWPRTRTSRRGSGKAAAEKAQRSTQRGGQPSTRPPRGGSVLEPKWQRTCIITTQ